jgi:hypothetical protein
MMVHPTPIVYDRGSDQRHADLAPHETHLTHHHRNDLYRRDRERRAEEQGGNQPLIGPGQHGLGQELTQRESTGEGHDNSCRRYAHGFAPGSLYQLEVRLHAGQQQKHQDAQRRDCVEHRVLLTPGGKDRALRLWPKRSKYRRAQHDPGDELPHDCGLADPLHDLAKQARDQKQQHDLRNEDRFGWLSCRLLRGEGGAHWAERGNKQRNECCSPRARGPEHRGSALCACHQDGTWGIPHDRLGDAAEQRPANAGPPMAADDDEIGAPLRGRSCNGLSGRTRLRKLERRRWKRKPLTESRQQSLALLLGLGDQLLRRDSRISGVALRIDMDERHFAAEGPR